MGLLALPHEFLAMICSRLDYTDILNIRRTCKVLRKISHSRDVWVGIFWNFVLRRKMPQPFIGLPKALAECSSEDLEKCMVKWEADWPPTVSANVSRLPVDTSLGFNKCNRTSLVPGGRWLLAAMDDGSICYFDLQVLSTDKELQPKILIPSPDPLESMHVNWFIFDTDFTMSSAANQTCHLTEFRIATCLSYSPDRVAYPSPTSCVNRVDVWHVKIVKGFQKKGGGHNGMNPLHAQHLSRVSAPHLIHCDLRLLGDRLAYHSNFADDPWSEGGKGAIEIVDWSTPNGAPDLDGEDCETDARDCETDWEDCEMDEEDCETNGRWFIPLDADANVLDFMLLPAGRILVLFEAEYTEPRSLYLYNYLNNGYTSYDPDDFDTVDPIWRSDYAHDAQWQSPLSELSFTIDGEARLVARNHLGLQLIRIPPPSRCPPASRPRGKRGSSAVIMECLCEPEGGDLGPDRDGEVSHHSRTINLEELVAYHHPPKHGVETCSDFRESTIECDEAALNFSHSTGALYDEFSNRVVYFDSNDSIICIVDLLV